MESIQKMDFNELQEMLKKGQHKNLVTRLESQLSDVAKNEKFLSLLVQSYNEYSISLLETGQVDLALECLKKAEHFVDASTNLRAKTFNNLACCYKKIGKNSLAMRYLEKALFLYPSGDFHLNMCAVLSVEGKHIRALQEAMYAIIYIQEEIIEKIPKMHEFNEPKWEALAVSYHNMAVELEFLQKSDESITFYKKALNICEKYIESQKLQEKLEDDMQNALKFLSKTKKKKENPINVVYVKKKRVVIKSTQSKSPNPRSQTSPNKVISLESRQEGVNSGQIKSNLRKFVSSGVSKNKMFEFRKTVPYGKKIQEDERKNERKMEEIGASTQRILRKISSDSEDESVDMKVRVDEDCERDGKNELVREMGLEDKAISEDDEEKKESERVEEKDKDKEEKKEKGKEKEKEKEEEEKKYSKDSYSEDWEGEKNKVKIEKLDEENKRCSDESDKESESGRISVETGDKMEGFREKCEGSVGKSMDSRRKNKEGSKKSEDYKEKNSEHERKSSKFTEESNEHERKSSEFIDKNNEYERKSSKYTEKSNEKEKKSSNFSEKSDEFERKSSKFTEKSNELERKSSKVTEKSEEFEKKSSVTEKSNEFERQNSKFTEKSQDSRSKSGENSKLSGNYNNLSNERSRKSYENSEKIPEHINKITDTTRENQEHSKTSKTSKENKSLSSELNEDSNSIQNLPSSSQDHPLKPLTSSSEFQNLPNSSSISIPNSETSLKITPSNPSPSSKNDHSSSDQNPYENSLKNPKSISSKPKTESIKSLENFIKDLPSQYQNPKTDLENKNPSSEFQSKINESSISYPIKEKSHTHSIVFDSITERPYDHDIHVAYMQTSRPSHSLSRSSSEEENKIQKKEENLVKSISPKPSTGKSKASGQSSRVPSGKKIPSPKKTSKSPVPIIKTRNSALITKKNPSKSPMRNVHSAKMPQIPDKISRPSSKNSEARKNYKKPQKIIDKDKMNRQNRKEDKEICEENKEEDKVLKIKGEKVSEIERNSQGNSQISLNNFEFGEGKKEFWVMMKCVVDLVMVNEGEDGVGERFRGKGDEVDKENSKKIKVSEGGSEKNREKPDNTVIIHSNTQSANFLHLLDLGEKSEYSMLIKPFYELLLISNGEFPVLSPISHNENADFSSGKEKIQRFNTIESEDSQDLYGKLILPKSTSAKDSHFSEDKRENYEILQGKTAENPINLQNDEENIPKNKNIRTQSENLQKINKNNTDFDEKYLNNMEKMQIFHSLVEKTLENSRKAPSSRESSVAGMENSDLALQNPNFYIETLLKTRGIPDNPDKNTEFNEKNEEDIGKNDQRPHRPINPIEKAAFNSQSSFRSIKKPSTDSKTEEKKIETPLCSHISNAPYPEIPSSSPNLYLSFKTLQESIEKPENAEKSNASDNFFNKKPSFSLSKNFSLQKKK